jgi:hypothetical protein
LRNRRFFAFIWLKIYSLPLSWPLLYIAVALTTLATLLLELSLTRIFSVVFYYHFAFLAISIALFGLGVGGVFSYVVGSWKGNLFRKLGLLSATNCALVVLAVVVVLANRTSLAGFELALVYVSCALPFFCSGIIVSLVISETIERVNRVYFFDLLGAAGGCLLLVPLLESFGGPNTTLAVAVLFAAAAGIWFNLAQDRFGRVASVSLALLLTLLVVLNYRAGWIDVRYAKGQQLAKEQFFKWNSFSRIGLRPETPGGMEAIFIDADAETGIANFNFDHLKPEERADLLHQGESLPYNVRPGAKTLIIGPGGGWDVARALASGSKDVTGVEINPIIAETIMQKKFPELSQRLYFRPEVHIFVHEGRSFIRGSADKYQVLQATLVDTWASTAAGAFALSENNLYTTEAFEEYLSHLTDDGILTITRWGFDPPRESLRLIALGIAALQKLGETDYANHFIVARADANNIHGWGARDTVLIARRAFSAADLDRARRSITDAKLRPVYVPGENIPNEFAELLHAASPTQYEKNYRYDITPVSDNRPFFFYTVQPRDLVAFLTAVANQKSADYTINKAVPLLFELLTISFIAVAVMLFLPPLVLGTRLPSEKSVQVFLLYFLLIGAGYILVEVALIQKFVLFLGHPTYALWVVIFSMLLSSGMGSYFSRKVVGDTDSRLVMVLAGVAGVVTILALSVGIVLTSLVSLPIELKILLSVLMISPAGFLMGIPFPIGLGRLEAWHKPALRWAWSLNAASSVLGSVGALVCAIYLGLMQTLLVGGLLYVFALLVFVVSRPSQHAAGFTLVQEEKVRT